jgi:hypothetical protein|tara:strand:- start:1067 stop:1264 length:198 start_codon:yes stop_codon:yes gene_type:complete
MNKEQAIKDVVNYLWESELKHFNEEYNSTNIYWDTEQEISLAIRDNWSDCKDHIFIKVDFLKGLI